MAGQDPYANFIFLKAIKNHFRFMKVIVYISLAHFNEATFKSLSAL